MKKLSIIIICALAVLIVSCTGQNNKSPKAQLTTDIDSLSYAIGVSQTNGLIPYLAQMNIDSTLIKEFLKGFYEGVSIEKDDVEKNAYHMGLKIGQQFGAEALEQFNQQIFGEESTECISKNNFIAGFTAGATNDNAIMDIEYAGEYANSKLEELQAKKMEMDLKKVEQEFGLNKEAGYKFLAENATQEGVVVLEGGLQYKVIKAGKGATPALNDRVKVHYKGMLIDGTVFDSTTDEPRVFGVTRVIAGWTEALTMMPVGSKWMLYIPQELAYGAQQQGPIIMPFSALVFEVELIGIEK